MRPKCSSVSSAFTLCFIIYPTSCHPDPKIGIYIARIQSAFNGIANGLVETIVCTGQERHDNVTHGKAAYGRLCKS